MLQVLVLVLVLVLARVSTQLGEISENKEEAEVVSSEHTRDIARVFVRHSPAEAKWLVMRELHLEPVV